jgi:NIMA (never in mitosis gene a)-related kinase
MIKNMLQVNPSLRPSCEQILHMPSLDEHIPEEDEYIEENLLLNTIVMPKNLNLLRDKLPKSNYEM